MNHMKLYSSLLLLTAGPPSRYFFMFKDFGRKKVLIKIYFGDVTG